MGPPTTGPPTDSLCELEDILDKALTVGWDSVDADQLGTDTAALTRIRAKIDALDAHVVHATDRSGVWVEGQHGNCAAMLHSQAPNRHRHEPRHRVRIADKTSRMPHAATAFDAGQITVRHVELLGQCLAPNYRDAFTEAEPYLVDAAVNLEWDGFYRVITQWKNAADTSEPDLADLKDQAARELHLSRSINNRGILGGTLTPLARTVVRSELDRITQDLFDQDWADAVERLGEGNVVNADLDRTAPQRRHDALAIMAQRSSGADADVQAPEPVIHVHCTEAELQAALEEDAGGSPEQVARGRNMRELEDGTPISRRTLVRLAIRAKIRRVVLGPAGEILQFGKTRRLFSPAQRAAIAVRDRVCACGCGLSARLCEADHVIEVRDNGDTDINNAQPLCHRSHRNKTNSRNRQAPRQGQASTGSM